VPKAVRHLASCCWVYADDDAFAETGRQGMHCPEPPEWSVWLDGCPVRFYCAFHGHLIAVRRRAFRQKGLDKLAIV